MTENEDSESEVEFESEEEENDIKIISQIMIKGNKRILPNTLDYYDFTNVICSRMEQMIAGAKPYVAISDSVEEMAIQEILQKKCPLALKKTVKIDRANGIEYVEEWAVNELRILPKCIANINSIILSKPFNFDEYIEKMLN